MDKVIISLDEYQELQILRRRYGNDTIRESIHSTTTLEQDIDRPIRLCVAMLTLIGCSPMWSCCGFDYSDQLLHKSHQYGKCGFVVLDNAYSRRFANTIPDIPLEYANQWRMSFVEHYGNKIGYLVSDSINKNTWPNPKSVHFSEPAVIAIGYLEEHLFGLRELFCVSATLYDSNDVWRQRFPAWQYPHKQPWNIERDSIIAEYLSIRKNRA